MKNKLQKTTTKITRQITFLILTLLLTVGAAQAAIYTVNSTTDAGDGTCDATCTLRDAVLTANGTTDDDIINFDPTVFSTPQTITLGGMNITINRGGMLTINGPTANLTISGNNASRVFRIRPGSNVEINNLTISDGNANFGGGIDLNGTLTLNNTTISNNSATILGGGIRTLTITLTLNNSTVSGNSAGGAGGGIYVDGNDVTLNNTTVSNNLATDGGGVYVNNSTLTLNNSIIANSTSGGDCSKRNGTTINASYSLIEDGLTCVSGTNDNNLTGDPNLGPLADNGGSTFTHALLTGSIAIDVGSNALIPNGITTDQRGMSRIVDGDINGSAIVDIGSFEVQVITAASVTISGRVLSGKRGVSNAIVYLTDQNGNIRTARTSSFGYYIFEDVEIGQTTIFNVYHRRYQFDTQVVTPNNVIENLDFTAQ